MPLSRLNLRSWQRSVDLILVLGGDGTMIGTARLMGDTEVPVLGVNYGGLGYLAEFRIEELYGALESILAGNYRLDKRVMLAVELLRGQEEVTRNRVLNDVVINKSALARIIEIEAYLNRILEFVPRRWFIVSTPTGSTAIQSSAGGPVSSLNERCRDYPHLPPSLRSIVLSWFRMTCHRTVFEN